MKVAKGLPGSAAVLILLEAGMGEILEGYYSACDLNLCHRQIVSAKWDLEQPFFLYMNAHFRR